MKRIVLVSTFVLITASLAFSQEKSKIKFGKVDVEDLKTTLYSLDSSANAVVLADIGSTIIVGNTKGSFSLEHKHFKRVHILNKSGYDIGDVSISLYNNDNDNEEELVRLKATTYNLENGKVVETKLDAKSDVFKEKVSKNWIRKKFTFPNLKEGSIIEFEYIIKSDFLFNLRPWEFQGKYPRLWTEYTVSIPEFIGYIFLNQGYMIPYIKDRKDRYESYTVANNATTTASDRHTFDAGVADHRWVYKDVPVLKEESFTSTLDNHITKIEFQLSQVREPLVPRNIMGSWQQVANELNKAEHFGAPLRRNNGWLGEMLDPLNKGIFDEKLKARNIYTYVQNNFTRTTRYGKYLNENLRAIVKNKKGSASELNLLLVAMLRYANIKATPVLLSTRGNGYTYAMYPLIDRFNYVVVKAMLEGETYYLDASEPRMGFGKLPYDCYNGHARIMDDLVTAIDLTPDSLMERKVSSVFLVKGKDNVMSGTFQQTPGYYESLDSRDQISQGGEEKFFATIKKGFNADIELVNARIDSLKALDQNIRIKYDFKLRTGDEEIVYFNPMFGEGFKENPFKSAERLYPVEMPYAIDENYIFRMDIPEGYVVDELPKQVLVRLNEVDPSFFEYRITESNGAVSLRTRLYMSRTYYLPEEYEILREFFNIIVNKHNEQIVFKRK